MRKLDKAKEKNTDRVDSTIFGKNKLVSENHKCKINFVAFSSIHEYLGLVDARN